MTNIAGVSDCVLERVVQKLQRGGTTTLVNELGEEVIVNVRGIDPARVCERYT